MHKTDLDTPARAVLGAYQKIKIGIGQIATDLIAAGVIPGQCTSYEVSIAPDKVVEAHMSVILTPDQFSAFKEVLRSHGVTLSDEAYS